MIVIVGATELELKKIKNIYSNTFELGVGIVNTAYNLTKLINSNKKKIKKVIMLGIGGGYKDRVKLLDICMASEEVNGDFGICFENKIEVLENNVIKIEDAFGAECSNCKKGTFITVNCVTTNRKIIDYYDKKYSPLCENMEGYAAAYVCQKEGIEFCEIRVISNYVGDRKNWKIKEAIDILYDTGKKIIQLFC